MNSLSLQVDLLDKRLLGIRVPDFVARKPRSLKESNHWKGK